MKARIINKENEYYNKVFRVKEVYGKFVGLNVENRTVDFGKSEIEIIAENDTDLFNLGRTLSMEKSDKTFNGFGRHSEIKSFVRQISFPAKYSTMEKALSLYIWT